MGIEILYITAALLWIIIGTSYLKWHPFIVLLTSALGLAVLLGLPLDQITPILGGGFGNTLQKIGLLILYGAWIGAALEASGATTALARGLLKVLVRLPLPFVVGAIGYLVAIPVFCDAAFVILAPLTKKLAAGQKVLRNSLTIALSTGLFATHVLVPPTPGPLAAAANLQLQNLFLLFVIGGLFALLLMLVGAAYAYYLAVSKGINPSAAVLKEALLSTEFKKGPSLVWALTPLLLPILLMALAALAPFVFSPSLTKYIQFLGTPEYALLLGVFFAFLLCIKQRVTRKEVIEKGIVQAAPILLITAMGGALGSVLQQVDLSSTLQTLSFSPSMGIALPFLLAALLKTAQGSSTVAIITTSSMVFPLLSGLGMDSEMGKIWTLLAVGTGAMTVSHANDSYFWIVSQMGELNLKEAYRTHTFATLLQGVVGFVLLFVAFTCWSML
ncbi:MAG: GntP family permease [Flavobacteriaceae bacterium]